MTKEQIVNVAARWWGTKILAGRAYSTSMTACRLGMFEYRLAQTLAEEYEHCLEGRDPRSAFYIGCEEDACPELITAAKAADIDIAELPRYAKMHIRKNSVEVCVGRDDVRNYRYKELDYSHYI